MPDPADDPFPTLPAHFGRYAVLRRLGRGGMGAVYLAEDKLLGRKVALKLPTFGPGDTGQRADRFVREAEAAAALQHPNVCTVFDAGRIDGRAFLTMAYLEGESLAARIGADRPPSPIEAADILRRVALGVEHAHAKGIIHRDLKPANILFTAGGEPVVTDFGLAKRVDGPGMGKLTLDGAVLGTPAYMAPEQVRGEADLIGPASDVYALGAVLFEVLTGRPPYTGCLTEILGQILAAPVPPPSEFRAGLDPRLDAICRRALAKEPGERYASAAAFAAALDEFVMVAPTVTAVVPPRRVPRSNRNVWIAAGIALAAGAAVLAVVLPRAKFSAPVPVAPAPETPAVAAAPAPVPPPAAKPAPPPLRHILTGHKAAVRQVLFSPDGSKVITGSYGNYIEKGGLKRPGPDNSVRVWNTATGKQYRHFDFTAERISGVQGLAVSPDGRTVAACTSWDRQYDWMCPWVYAWRIDTGERTRHQTPKEQVKMHCVSITDDGMLRVARAGQIVYSWAGPDASREEYSYDPDHKLTPRAFSADGRRLFAAGQSGGVVVLTAATGAVEGVLSGHVKPAGTATPSPDGRWLTTAAPDFSVRVWELDTFRQAFALTALESEATAAAVTPDGTKIVTGHDDGAVKLWDAATGKELVAFAGHTGRIFSVAISPDGTAAATASADLTARVWNLP